MLFYSFLVMYGEEDAHHKESAGDPGGHNAGKGLKHLAHGGIPNEYDPAPFQALLKVLRIEVVQRAAVRLKHLPVLLRLQLNG